jgi:1,4-dihydroxy-2-naphthoate polyprenyltransferase
MKDVKPVKLGWCNVFRPRTLYGAVIPVFIGGAIAWKDGYFCWWIFILILIGGGLMQSAANLLNTYGDYVKGTDTKENHIESPELVFGVIKPKQVLLMGMACLGVTALLGLVFIWYAGWQILIIGLIGIGGAAFYTVGVSYKYHAVGLFGVLMLMGILMPIGTYLVLTGGYSWEVVLASLPNAFILTAVLSGNETRDYYEDKRSNVGTLSGHLSYVNSMRLYLILNSISFLILALIILFGVVPWTCTLAFLTLYDLYLVVINSKKASSDLNCSRLLVPLSFKLNWHFGVLFVIGYLLGYVVI